MAHKFFSNSRNKKYKEKMNGFTLVELLAVIIIIAILFMVAIPAISEQIDSSRKSSYIRSAEGYIDGVDAMIVSKTLIMRRTDTTYYVPIECIDTDKGAESPYGSWVGGYVAVTYADSNYDYYWTSTDESGRGILLTYSGLLDGDKIRNNITAVGTYIGVGDRDKIRIVDSETCKLGDTDYSPMEKIDEKGAMEKQQDTNPTEKPNGFISVSPSGWSQSKTVTINYQGAYVAEYSIDGGKTFKRYTTPITISQNGTVIGRITDGVYYIQGITQSIVQIDTTPPTEASFTYTKTSNSITVTASGTDSESGISRYQFSKDDGKTWTSASSTNTYSFIGLKTGEYHIKVRVINGTYVSNGIKENYKESETIKASTSLITTPTYSVSPSGWARSKTVTINYSSEYTNEYSLDGGASWKKYTSPVVVTSNVTVIARSNDGTNYVSGSALSVTQIDTTAPTEASFTYTRTSNSITVVAKGQDAESGISIYQFSKDDGKTWTEERASKTYTFTNLSKGKYPIKVRVVNGTYVNGGVNNNYRDSSKIDVETIIIEAPKYSVSPSSWAQSKTVTISYPSGYTNEYSIDGGTSWKKYESPVTFTNNGTIIARASDGTNSASGSALSVTQIDTTAPSSATFSYTTTSNSITVTASGTDNESTIARYQFSNDNGVNWTAATTNNYHTFTGLTAGTYKIKIRAINGTYVNNGISANYTDSVVKDVATEKIEDPTYSLSPLGWFQSKTVTISYPEGYTNEYSIDGGITWQKYTAPITFTEPGTIIARVNDGVNYVKSVAQSITQIEKTAPTLTVSSASGSYKTSGTIKITAADTGGSGLLSSNKYQYYLSTSNTTQTGGSWTVYTSDTNFTISGTNQTKYLWVYPVSDNAKNINGSYTSTTTPYVIGTYKFDSILPTLSATSTEASGTVTIKITAADTGGSNLSSSNKYQYCLSTSSSSVTGCTWTNYTNNTAFNVTLSETRYLYVYAIKDNAGNVNESRTFNSAYMIRTIVACPVPTYTYTGTAQYINDGNCNYRIKFLTSGTLIFTSIPTKIDVFLVGGGGGGGANGGGGGYTKTVKNITATAGTSYPIVIGEGGNGIVNGGDWASKTGTASTAFGQSAAGGQYGNWTANGGSGGGAGGHGTGNKNGNGGSNGADGGGFSGSVGQGQGTTTREFGEATGDLYAGGGGGAGYGSGGLGGGGQGGDWNANRGPGYGQANTGGGGGGATLGSAHHGVSGGSGIVIIRNSR